MEEPSCLDSRALPILQQSTTPACIVVARADCKCKLAVKDLYFPLFFLLSCTGSLKIRLDVVRPIWVSIAPDLRAAVSGDRCRGASVCSAVFLSIKPRIKDGRTTCACNRLLRLLNCVACFEFTSLVFRRSVGFKKFSFGLQRDKLR